MARRSRRARRACTRSRSRDPLRSPMGTARFRRVSAALRHPPGLSFRSHIKKGNQMTLQRAAFYPLALLLIHASLSFGQPTIKLIAGGNAANPLGDGGPAVNAFIGEVGNITV